MQEVEVRCRCGPIHPLLDDGKRFVEIPPHSFIVCPLSGKHKNERGTGKSSGLTKIPCCPRDLTALGETILASARAADLWITVSASSSDGATTANRQSRPSNSVRKKEMPWGAGSAPAFLSTDAGRFVRTDHNRTHFIHRLLYLHNVVGTSKPKGVDLKPSWLAVLPFQSSGSGATGSLNTSRSISGSGCI